MDVMGQLQRQYVDYLSSLYFEGYLDDQFTQLQDLQDESNPEFVAEMVCLFFEDSQKVITNMGRAMLHSVDFKQVDAHVHQLKGSSSSIGAIRLTNLCGIFRTYCKARNMLGCVRCLQQVKDEYILLKNKMEILLMLEQQIRAAGGSIRKNK